jgi:RNA polymerase sigma-70 factor (ECF subfamily)
MLAAVAPRPAFALSRVTTATVEESATQRSPADAAMDRYARGEDDAFAELYDLLAPRLYGYFLRQTRNGALADDLTQQTLVKIHRARGQFSPGAAVRPWAFAIGRRLLIDSVRRTRRERVSSGDDAALDAAVAEAPRADDLVQAQETARRIQRALLTLPASQRVAFELVKQEGLTFVEAAEVLGATVAAVKLRAHRAYEALRAVLGDVLDEERSDPDGTRSTRKGGRSP